jgi:hypothetical protein
VVTTGLDQERLGPLGASLDDMGFDNFRYLPIPLRERGRTPLSLVLFISF